LAELRSKEDVEAWVNSRPKSTRRVDTLVFCSRTSLTVLPFVFHQANIDQQWFESLITAVFYASAASRVSILFPSSQTGVALHSASGVIDTYDKSHYSAARSAWAAVNIAFTNADLDKEGYVDAATFVASAAVDNTYTYADRFSYAAYLERSRFARKGHRAGAWTAISLDATLIEELGARKAMARPLARPDWRHGVIGKRWQEFQDYLHIIPYGHVWIDWYKRILTGQTASKEVEEAYLLLDAPKIFWSNDFPKVCAEIAKRLQEIEEKEKQFKPSKDRDFFISYNTEDEAFAREVNDLVEDAGFTTVVQFRDFKNSNFISEMNKGLARSKRIISVLTENYVKSDACEAEWNYFFNKDRKSSSRLIVHLLFEDSDLLPLQQQIVYTNLIGKKRTDRRALIIEAINHEPKTYSQAEAREALANSASPFVKLGKDDELTAGPHPTLDTPLAGSELDQIIDALLGFIGPLLKSLSGQSPVSTREALTEYQIHLSKNRKKSIVGLLSGLAAAVQSSKSDADPMDWGNGVLSLLSSFEENHQRLISFYNEKPKRDRLHAEINLDQDKASGADLARPVQEVTKAIQDYDGPITEDLKAAFNDLSKAVSGIANDQRETPEDAGLVTPKKSVVLTFIGSLERFYNLAGSTASIASTPQGQALISALEKALNQLTRFII
jgi:hypothetical protein